MAQYDNLYDEDFDLFEDDFDADEADLFDAFEDEDLEFEDWDELRDLELADFIDLDEEPISLAMVVGFFQDESQANRALDMLEDMGLTLEEDITVLRQSEALEDIDEEESWQTVVQAAIRSAVRMADLGTSVNLDEIDALLDEGPIDNVQIVILAKVLEEDVDEIQEAFFHSGAIGVQQYTGADADDFTP